MKKSFLLICFVIFIHTGYSQNRKIEFVEKPWKEILGQAKEQNKMIFLDAYASWCGPCKWMAKNMFTKDSVADYFNQKFICASIDMEKGEGLDLAKKYSIRVYPTLLFLDSAGNVLHRKAGAPQRVQDYIELANVAMDPERRLATIEKKYKAGDRSALLMMNYMKQLQEAYIPFQKVLTEYFATQPEKDLTNRANWTITYWFVNETESPQFKYLLNHREEYAKLYTADSVNGKIVSVYENTLSQMARNYQVSDSIYNRAKEIIRATKVPGIEKAIFNTDLMYYATKQKRDKFLELSYNDLDKFYSNDPDMLNNVSQMFSQTATDPKHIEKALEWSKRSTELKSDPNYLDTYSTLLAKAGKKDEAIRQEKAAINLAKSQGKPAEQFESRLRELEK